MKTTPKKMSSSDKSSWIKFFFFKTLYTTNQYSYFDFDFQYILFNLSIKVNVNDIKLGFLRRPNKCRLFNKKF